MRMRMRPSVSGFSLVELSIVLVILGLLTGGILTGQSLIKAAEIRQTIKDYENFRTAVHLFKNKYFYLPGDMPNATQFWGIAGGNGQNNACYQVAAVGTETCNGDGNGQIEGSSPWYNEELRAWQHLANAGLINGSFTGAIGHDQYYQPNVNIPSSRIGSATGWRYYHTLGGAGDNIWFQETNTSYVMLLSGVTNLSLVPEDLWNIDKKIDDGKPGGGVIRALKTSGCTTVDGISPPGDTNGEYNLPNRNIACRSYFKMPH